MNINVERVELADAPTLVIRGHCAFPDIGDFLSRALAETAALATSQNVPLAGPPFGRYRPNGDGWDNEVGSAYEVIEDWLDDHGSAATAQAWESHLDGPDATARRTEIIQPFRR